MAKIERIEYKDSYGKPQEAIVGKNNVRNIEQHSAQGEGDRWFYDINFENGDTFRIFDPVFVAFSNPQ